LRTLLKRKTKKGKKKMAKSEYATNYDILSKVILIGDSGVGKSSLLYRYTDNDWNPHYIATIGVDFKVTTFERAGKVLKLQLWDTAGQERFKTITQSYYRGAHGVLIVYDVTNRESFQNVVQWLREVRALTPATVPVVLVANKCDLDSQRLVTAQEGRDLATELSCTYVEASAKSDVGVATAFHTLVDSCLERRLGMNTKTVGQKPVTLPPSHRVAPKKDSGCFGGILKRFGFA